MDYGAPVVASRPGLSAKDRRHRTLSFSIHSATGGVDRGPIAQQGMLKSRRQLPRVGQSDGFEDVPLVKRRAFQPTGISRGSPARHPSYEDGRRRHTPTAIVSGAA
jgi:hypothetical protein